MRLYLMVYFEPTLEFNILHDPHQFSLFIHYTKIKIIYEQTVQTVLREPAKKRTGAELRVRED